MSEPFVPYHNASSLAKGWGAEPGHPGHHAASLGSSSTIRDLGVREVRRRVVQASPRAARNDYRAGDVLTLTAQGPPLPLPGEEARRLPLPRAGFLKACRARRWGLAPPASARYRFPLSEYSTGGLGYGLAIHNPLVHPERIFSRALKDALSFAAFQRRGEELQVRERLQDIILKERVITAYQPILRLKDKTVLGFEALSRGPRGTGLESADALFGAATAHELLRELDRLCAPGPALLGPHPLQPKLFVYRCPHDPDPIPGQPLIDFLDRARSPPSASHRDHRSW